MSIKTETVSGLKWAFVERFSVQFIQFILGMIMARLLTPEDYGIIGMLAIFMAISQSLIDSGFSNALIRKQNRTHVDFSTAFYVNIGVGILCYAILFFSAPFIASFFDTEILSPILRVMAVNLFVNSLAVVQIAKLTIAIDFKTQAKASSAAALLSGMVGIFMAYQGYGVWSLVTQSVISTCTNVSLLWIFSKWHPSFIFSWASFHELFAYGSKIMVSGLIHTIYANLATLVIGKFYSSKDLGNYTRGQQFPTLLSSNLTGILQRVTYPILSKIQDDDKRLATVYRKYIKLTSMGILFLLTLLAAVAKPLVLILLTDKWLDAVVFLQIFCFAMMFDHINQINLNLLQVKGRSDLFLKLEVIKKIISFSILLISIPLGVIAICVSKIVYTQIAIVINTYYTGRIFKIGYTEQLKDFSPYFIFSVISCIPAFLMTFFDWNNYLILFFGSFVSLLLYVSLLKLKKDDLFNEYGAMLLRKILLVK